MNKIIKTLGLAGLITLGATSYLNAKNKDVVDSVYVTHVDEEQMSTSSKSGVQHYEFISTKPVPVEYEIGIRIDNTEKNFVVLSSTPLKKGDKLKITYTPKKRMLSEVDVNANENVDIQAIDGVIKKYSLIRD